jgi:leucyl aminopeptidase
MVTEFIQKNPAAASTDLLVVFAVNKTDSKDKKAFPTIELLHTDDAVKNAVAGVAAAGEFAAASCETLLIHNPNGLAAKRLLVVGLAASGKTKTTIHELRKAAGTGIRFAKPRKIRGVTLLVPDAAGFDPKFAGRALAEGAILADFDSDTYKSDRVDRALEKTTIISADGDATMLIRAGVLEGDMIAHAQNFARALVLEPGNKLTPTMLGERAAAMATASGLKSEVYGAAKLHELKMGAFWSVSQGSAEPPALIVITYEPENTKPDAPVLGLVGKGITFDTGGISIKPADGMEKMKYDMAGAAAMLGAMQAIAALKPSVKVIGVVCSAENMPSGTAQKPGDIQTAMSGKTIEVMNTDAEGRLVLADGITYAKQLGATHLIDAATLTGAVGIALGQINGGAFSNDDDTYAKFVNALEVSGERFWRLPVEDDYRDQIKSTIADIMNTGKTRHGGAINGAMFLKEFAEDTPWIHLDIAAVAWSDEQKPWLAAGPTGVAVRSILEWVRSYSE